MTAWFVLIELEHIPGVYTVDPVTRCLAGVTLIDVQIQHAGTVSSFTYLKSGGTYSLTYPALCGSLNPISAGASTRMRMRFSD